MEDMSLREALAEAAKFLAIAAAKDISSLPGQEVLDAVEDLEKVRRLEEGLSSKVVAAVDAQGLWALDGARSLPAWLRNKTGRTDVTSRTAVKNARALSQHLPGTANALAAGQIGADHAAALARHAATTDRLRQQLRDPDKGEDFLLKHAHTLDATAFTHVVRAWAIAADPDSAERGWREEKDREEVFLSRTTGGWALKGWLSESSGEVLSTAIAAQTGVPSKDDKRTPAQRRADAVVSLARRALDSGALRPGSRIRPHVAVNVSYETLQGLAEATTCPPGSGCGASASDIGASASDIGVPCQHHPEVDEAITTTFDIAALTGKEPPTLPDGAPVPYGLFARLVCGSALHRVVFGPDSEVLDVGREERLFTAAQTRAIIARDRHCQYPGCNAPPGDGEIHHSITWWAQNGPTNTGKGVLLCWHHHDHVHAQDITITRQRGRWRFHRRDGTEIEDPANHQAA